MVKLDLYRAHKLVRAAVIQSVDHDKGIIYLKTLSGDVVERHLEDRFRAAPYMATPGAMYVEYLEDNKADGEVDFTSISPGQKFEDGYTHEAEPVEPQVAAAASAAEPEGEKEPHPDDHPNKAGDEGAAEAAAQ